MVFHLMKPTFAVEAFDQKLLLNLPFAIRKFEKWWTLEANWLKHQKNIISNKSAFTRLIRTLRNWCPKWKSEITQKLVSYEIEIYTAYGAVMMIFFFFVRTKLYFFQYLRSYWRILNHQMTFLRYPFSIRYSLKRFQCSALYFVISIIVWCGSFTAVYRITIAFWASRNDEIKITIDLSHSPNR